jgi:hypothetical protein
MSVKRRVQVGPHYHDPARLHFEDDRGVAPGGGSPYGAAPDNHEVVDWGITFYERLQGRSDDALEAGYLPRSELDSGLAELKARRPGGGGEGSSIRIFMRAEDDNAEMIEDVVEYVHDTDPITAAIAALEFGHS